MADDNGSAADAYEDQPDELQDGPVTIWLSKATKQALARRREMTRKSDSKVVTLAVDTYDKLMNLTEVMGDVGGLSATITNPADGKRWKFTIVEDA